MTKPKISAVINTWNEGKNLAECLDTLDFVDEIIVVDMASTDDTKKIAKQYTDKVYDHPYVGYVEPARNFAISKATSEWVFVLDPDEEVSDNLKDKLVQIVSNNTEIDFIRIPRKNIIFGKWMKASMWWPDYNIRFFKKNSKF